MDEHAQWRASSVAPGTVLDGGWARPDQEHIAAVDGPSWPWLQASESKLPGRGVCRLRLLGRNRADLIGALAAVVNSSGLACQPTRSASRLHCPPARCLSLPLAASVAQQPSSLGSLVPGDVVVGCETPRTACMLPQRSRRSLQLLVVAL
jgi:hypothetical protein